jgi:hypothetical protein
MYKERIVDFRHIAEYHNNVFQHKRIEITTDRCQYSMQGVHSVDHVSSTSMGIHFKTPAAVFAALNERRLDGEILTIELEEPEMFHIHMIITGANDRFIFQGHACHQERKL